MKRMISVLILCCLASACAAQSALPPLIYGDSLSTATGPWLAYRQDEIHIVAWYGALSPATEFPADAIRINPRPGILPLYELTQAQADAMRQDKLDVPAFAPGQSYRLLLDGGPPIPVLVTRLLGASGDPEVGTYSTLGAVLAVPEAAWAVFHGAGNGPWVLERSDSPFTRAKQSPQLGTWGPAPAGIEELAGEFPPKVAIRGQMPTVGDPITYSAQKLFLGAEGSIYLLKATWPENRTAENTWREVEYVFARLGTAPQILSQVGAGVVSGSELALNEEVLRLVDLGNGSTAIIFRDGADYVWGDALLEMIDGQLRLIYVLGGRSD